MKSYEERVTDGERLCKADGQNKELPVDIDSMSWMAHNVEKIVRAKSSDEKKLMSSNMKYAVMVESRRRWWGHWKCISHCLERVVILVSSEGTMYARPWPWRHEQCRTSVHNTWLIIPERPVAKWVHWVQAWTQWTHLQTRLLCMCTGLFPVESHSTLFKSLPATQKVFLQVDWTTRIL